MKDFLAFLTAACLLGIAESLSAVAWAAFAILLLMAAVTRPRAAFAFLASVGLLAIALRAPAATAAALAVIGAASVVAGRARAPRAAVPTPLLPRPD